MKFHQKVAKIAVGAGKSTVELFKFLRLLVVLAIAVAVAFTAWFIYDGSKNVWQVGSSLVSAVTGTEKPKTIAEQKAEERRIVDEANFKCLSYAGADDGKDRTPAERGLLAVTTLNLATENAAPVNERIENGKKVVDKIIDACVTYGSFAILMLPDQSTDQYRTLTTARPFLSASQISQTAAFLRQYMTDPKVILEQWPWLPKSTQAIRMPWKFFGIIEATPTQDKEGMRKAMCRLWGTPGKTTEFFRSKKPEEQEKGCDPRLDLSLGPPGASRPAVLLYY